MHNNFDCSLTRHNVLYLEFIRFLPRENTQEVNEYDNRNNIDIIIEGTFSFSVYIEKSKFKQENNDRNKTTTAFIILTFFLCRLMIISFPF